MRRPVVATLTALTLLAIAACAGPVKYAPQPEIPLARSSLDVARDASLKVEAMLGQNGDFSPGDLVRLSFPYTPALTTDQRIQLSGMISPPLLAPVQTRGLTAVTLQARLAELYRPKLARPEVSIAVLEYNRPPPPPEIFVVGEVIRPGNFPYRDATTPFEGIARAGGANRDADMSRVVALTPIDGKLVARMLDLNATLEGDGRAIEYLAPYTILMVPPTGLARDVDRARQIRQIIGFNGFNIGSAVTLIQP